MVVMRAATYGKRVVIFFERPGGEVGHGSMELRIFERREVGHERPSYTFLNHP
jgi:hypothetical protein